MFQLAGLLFHRCETRKNAEVLPPNKMTSLLKGIRSRDLQIRAVAVHDPAYRHTARLLQALTKTNGYGVFNLVRASGIVILHLASIAKVHWGKMSRVQVNGCTCTYGIKTCLLQ